MNPPKPWRKVTDYRYSLIFVGEYPHVYYVLRKSTLGDGSWRGEVIIDGEACHFDATGPAAKTWQTAFKHLRKQASRFVLYLRTELPGGKHILPPGARTKKRKAKDYGLIRPR